jgi:flagellar hook-associated protein 2
MATSITSATPATPNPVSNTPAPVTTVASSGSAGAAGGSVINVKTLVSELVAATEAPQQQVIANQTSAVTAQVSALGTLKGALSTFQSSLNALSTASAFNAETATSSDPKVFTAISSSGAVGGSYNVTVSNLASAEQLLSGPFTGDSSAVVGTGALTLTLGSTSFNVAIGSGANTLAGIASAINSANNNPGITATVIQGTTGAHLLLSSSLTGAANTITVAETDGGNALAALTYGAGNLGHYAQNATAADAVFSVAGVAYTNASNTVSNAISGVTLTLLGAGTVATPDSATLTVANDTTTIQQNIANFVSAYNTMHSSLAGLSSFDPNTGTAGAFLGNPVLTGTQNQLQRALYSIVGSSNYNSLASIGITTQSDGTLSLNSNTLQTALSTNFSAVSRLFSGTQGIASQLNTQITAELASGGSIDSYGQTLTKQENSLTTQTNTLNTQMSALTASLTQQYSALNALLSSLQTTSAYLTQAFASLPTVQGQPNA